MKSLVFVAASVAIAHADPVIVPGATQSAAHGQAFVQVDTIGTPIAIVEVELLSGVWYELQTFDLQSVAPIHATPDTIVTIRDGNGVDAVTLAGADVCETPGAEPDERRSCVRFRIDPARYPNPHMFHVWIRAQVTGQRGTTDLRIQRLLDAGDIPRDTACTQAGQFLCWDLVANDRPFGGLTVRAGSGSSSFLHLETTALPAMDEHESMILIVPGALDDPDRNWQIASSTRGGPRSHRSGAAGAAEWVGLGSDAGIVDDTATFVATTTSWFAAPIRLLRNDRVAVHLNGANFVVGTDFDGDGLGADLEHVLRTCDSVASATFGNMPCSERTGCSADASSTLCKAALRDSDGDGLRDDHELYGVSGSLTELPRFGADPARYDMFVELDRRPNGCVPEIAPPMYGNLELRDLALIYRSIEGFANRDGSNGIFIHVDSGTVPDEPYETAHGRWGGAGTASVTATHEASMDVSRRFAFHHVFRQCERASNAFHSTLGTTNDLVSFAHELGHSGGLAHGGPLAFTGGMNYKPNQWSRINYFFQNISNGHIGETPPDPGLQLVTFSRGQFANHPLNPRDADEACPFGAGTDTSYIEPTLQNLTGFLRHDEYPGCASVDWNGDRRIAGPGETIVTPLLAEPRRIRETRYRVSGNAITGGDLTTAGSLLYWLHLREDSGERVLAVTVNREIDCDECDLRNAPCWDPNRTDDEVVLRADNTVSSAAIAGRVGADSQPLALVIYTGFDARLHYGLLRGTTPAWTELGIVPASLALAGPTQSRIADATAFGDGFEIVYRASGGRAVTQHARLSGPGLAWDPPVDVLDDAGAPLVPVGDSSPAIGTIELPGVGEELAIVMADPQPAETSRPPGDVTVRVRGGGRWSKITHVRVIGGVQGRPSFAQPHYGDTTFVAVSWLGTGTSDHELFFRRLRIPATTSTELIDSDDKHFYRREGRVLKAPHTMPLYFDRRGPQSQWGLRAVYGEWVECGGEIVCPAGNVCRDPSAGADPDDVRITCQSSDGQLATTFEHLVPFADGIFAGRIYDFDERPALRHGFCQALRTCNEHYTDETCIPDALVERDEDGVPLDDAPCAPEPTYEDMTCDPVLADRDGDGTNDDVDLCPDSPTGDLDIHHDGCPDDFDDILDLGEDLVPRLRGDILLIVLLPGISDRAANSTQKAIDHLIGNDDGAADNGMLDKLRSADWVAAGSAARLAVRSLLDANAAGFDTKREQAEVALVYREALALRVPKQALANGDALRKAGDYEGAIIAYKDAAKRL